MAREANSYVSKSVDVSLFPKSRKITMARAIMYVKLLLLNPYLSDSCVMLCPCILTDYAWLLYTYMYFLFFPGWCNG